MEKRKDMKSVMTSHISDFLRTHGIRKVLLGISGGADSVALLRLLSDAGADIVAVHCNFHLRGEESERDMKFTADLCKQTGTRLEIVDFDTVSYCSEKKLSVEMGCRELRYDYFRKSMEKNGCDRIAVAHHLDDNIETLFLNLMRGSGVAGLKGMLPDTGEIIRPLLQFSRKDILAYLEEIGQSFIIDSSNSDIRYRRNFIRNRLIPLLETEWKGARKALARSIELLQEDYSIVDKTISGVLSRSDCCLNWEDAVETGSPVTTVFRFICGYGGNSTMAQEIVRHFSGDNHIAGKRWITEDYEIVASAESLHILTKRVEEKAQTGLPECFEVEQVINNEENFRNITKPGKPVVFVTPNNPACYIFRQPETGDRIKPLGMKGSSKISDIMKDAGLTPPEKRNIWIAEDRTTGEIIWVEGLKRSRLHLVSAADKSFYMIKRK